MKDKIIEQIRGAIENKFPILSSMGVCNGLAGVSLFYYYYAAYKKDPDYLEMSVRFLEESIDGLNDGYRGTTILRDIVEIGTLLNFYAKESIIDKSDIGFFYSNFDDTLVSFFRESLSAADLSPISGAIHYGYYFIERLRDKDFSAELSDLIDRIEELSWSGPKGIYWYSSIERQGHHLVELGGSHGIAGVVSFLLHAYDNGIQQERVRRLITGALEYLLLYRHEDSSLYTFPFDTTEKKANPRINLAYGDLSIGYVFYKAGKLLGIDAYRLAGIEILTKSGNVRDEGGAFVKDAILLYGSEGISSFFSLFKRELATDRFDSAIQYWKGKTLSFNSHGNEFAGYRSYFNQFDVNTPLSLMNGIAGIGISLMAEEVGANSYEFLKYLRYTL
ncbi:MAG: hypothetical protein JST42_02650 [Bacteroidetes bacterium]|nr:hypothetical protein [Bacteroidota bacterium]